MSTLNKTAIITGGAGLLGPEHALALNEIGYNVVILDINKISLNKTYDFLKKKLSRNTKLIKYHCDITKEKQINKILRKLINKKLSIDVLVNNADCNPKMKKISSGRSGQIETYIISELKKELEVGIVGTFICSKIFGTHMSKNNGGVILNIASDLSVISPNNSIYNLKGKQSYKPVSYSTVKTGIIGLTKYVATHWAKKNIRCNALSPGGVFTNQNQRFVNNIKKLIPMGRMANRDEYISTIQFLCSDASSYLTGQNIVVDGGRSIW